MTITPHQQQRVSYSEPHELDPYDNFTVESLTRQINQRHPHKETRTMTTEPTPISRLTYITERFAEEKLTTALAEELAELAIAWGDMLREVADTMDTLASVGGQWADAEGREERADARADAGTEAMGMNAMLTDLDEFLGTTQDDA